MCLPRVSYVSSCNVPETMTPLYHLRTWFLRSLVSCGSHDISHVMKPTTWLCIRYTVKYWVRWFLQAKDGHWSLSPGALRTGCREKGSFFRMLPNRAWSCWVGHPHRSLVSIQRATEASRCWSTLNQEAPLQNSQEAKGANVDKSLACCWHLILTGGAPKQGGFAKRFLKQLRNHFWDILWSTRGTVAWLSSLFAQRTQSSWFWTARLLAIWGSSIGTLLATSAAGLGEA